MSVITTKRNLCHCGEAYIMLQATSGWSGGAVAKAPERVVDNETANSVIDTDTKEEALAGDSQPAV